jgi:hypothetical protein
MRGLVEYSSSSGGGSGDNGAAAAAAAAAATAAAPSTSSPGPATHHHGRVRSFPHVDGQYAVHVHVPACPPDDVAASMRRCVAEVRRVAVPSGVLPAITTTRTHHSLHPSIRTHTKKQLSPAVPGLTPVAGLAPPTPSLHLSLSRVAPVRGRDVPALVDGLVATLTEASTGASSSASESSLPAFGFDVDLAGPPVVLVNEEGTQCFLAAACPAAGCPPAFRAAVRAADAAGALVGLPPFYPDPLPHVSFAWAPAASAPDLRREVEAWWGAGDARLAPWRLGVRAVAVKAGKRVAVVWRARGEAAAGRL